MRTTRFIVLSGMLLLFIIIAASGETVMLYSEKPTGAGDEIASLRTMEDGIMEVFFDAGHIIFNDDYQNNMETAEAELIFSDTPVFRSAKSGGASFVLTVRLSFTDDENEKLPVAAEYEFVKLETEECVARGKVMLPRRDGEKQDDPYTLVLSMGKTLGIEALKGL